MRKLLTSLVALILAATIGAPAFAQSSPGAAYPQHFYYATDYDYQIRGWQANTYTFYPTSVCQSPTATGTQFPFSTNAPIWIADSVLANSETVTPSAIVQGSALCGVTMTPTNQHYSFTLRSGTAGLQEALNSIGAGAASTYPALLYIDRSWYTTAASVPSKTPAQILGAVVGNATVMIADLTATPIVYYQWTGAKYAPATFGGPVPTGVVANTGAGTGGAATIQAGSTGASGVIKVVTGTSPTASAIVYTVTFATVANGGFQYAPVCTTNSTGATLYSTGVSSSAVGPPATYILTASGSALTASTTYYFSYRCR